MRIANIEIASSAPVLPADTTVSARPSAAAWQASHMLDWRRRRSAKDGLSSALTASAAGTISTAWARPLRLSTSGLSFSGSPNSR